MSFHAEGVVLISKSPATPAKQYSLRVKCCLLEIPDSGFRTIVFRYFTASGNSVEAFGRVVRLCKENALLLAVRAAGTNLSGGTISKAEGLVVPTNALNRILEINAALDPQNILNPCKIIGE